MNHDWMPKVKILLEPCTKEIASVISQIEEVAVVMMIFCTGATATPGKEHPGFHCGLLPIYLRYIYVPYLGIYVPTCTYNVG